MNDIEKIKESLKSASCLDDVRAVCKSIDIDTLKISVARRVLRSLRQFRDDGSDREMTRRVRIAYLGNMTFEPLPEYVELLGLKRDISVSGYVGGYAQYMQELISETSGLAAFEPDFIFINLLLRELAPDAVNGFSGLSAEQLHQHRESVLNTVSECVRLALSKHGATVVVSNFPSPHHYHYGIADQKQDYGEDEFYAELNLGLKRLLKKEPRAHLFDMERLTALFGKRKAFEDKLYYLAKVPWQEDFYPLIADQLIRHIEADLGLTKKCLVVDLDNTLWGGVLGEAGPHGVKVGHGDGESEAFLEFQRKIISLKNRGILLGICSKNNPEDVQEVFDLRSDMPLSLSDFSAIEINWEMKHSNLERIAQKLNIGIDSLVFIDDNPAECELIQQLLPSVQTVLLPRDPAEYPSLLDNLHGFEKAVVAADDRQKAKQYAENASRSEHRGSFGDLESYLESLQTVVRIGLAEEGEKQRVHQLFTKTNQFNLTTKRYSLAEVEQYLENDDYDLYTVQASDRFGDLGTIGLCLVDMTDSDVAVIDSFILSCRAMGRGIESAVMNFLKEKYLVTGANSALRAMFIPTQKNRPAENFYTSQGFKVLQETAVGETVYGLSANEVSMTDCHWVEIKEREVI